ncbi:hypothetical protein Tco_0099077 [Tanacetum coccineum]
MAPEVLRDEASNEKLDVYIYEVKCLGHAIQANMDVKNSDYFSQLLPLENAYRISEDNKTSLIFGRYIQVQSGSARCGEQNYLVFRIVCSCKELKVATDDFSGMCKTWEQAAIKVVYVESRHGAQEFLTEIEVVFDIAF